MPQFVSSLLLVFVLWSSMSKAELFVSDAPIRKGDHISNLCWQGISPSGTFCLDELGEKVRVLIYNAGSCEPCRREIPKWVTLASSLRNQPVTFVSLSIADWDGEVPPTYKFLEEWKKRYDISFSVAAAQMNELQRFFGTTHLWVPATVIVDKKGNLREFVQWPDEKLERATAIIRRLLAE